MRLTLRTLLAYLDDILEPSQTKQLGNKLADSKFASDLVDRIREVMRRRRLTAPQVDGSDNSLDANVVAQYLDNTLPPEKVTEVEKRCLESDMHLAEAAACHQILTIVLGEPVEIGVESRRRMYELVSPGSGDDEPSAVAATTPPAGSDPHFTVQMSGAAQTGQHAEAANGDLPDYLKPASSWMKFVTFALLAMVVLMFVWLSATDPGNKWGGAQKSREGEVVNSTEPKGDDAERSAKPLAAEPPEAIKPAVAPLPSPPSVEIASAHGETGEKPAPGKPVLPALPPVDGGAKLPGDTSPAKPAPPAVSATVTPNAPLPMPSTTPSGVPTPPAPGLPAPNAVAIAPSKLEKPAPAVEPPPDVRVLSNSGILLGYDPERTEWYALERPGLTLPPAVAAPQETPLDDPAKESEGNVSKSRRSAKSTRSADVPEPPVPMPKGPPAASSPRPASGRRADQLVAPEPFDSQLEFGQGQCRLWLIGGSSVRLLGSSEVAPFGIEVRQGRLVIRNAAPTRTGVPGVGASKSLALSIVVRDEIWKLELLRPDTQVGIEILPNFPRHPGEDAKETSYRGGLYVTRGQVRFIEMAGRQRTIDAGRWIPLAPADRAVPNAAGGTGFRLASGPSWLNPDQRRSSSALGKLARDFEKEFIPGQAVGLSISTVAKDDRPKISELAVKTLALTSEYEALAEVLSQVPHEESVEAAAQGLRSWLPLGPNHGAVLGVELQNAFVPADAGIVLRLLWGYNGDDGRDRATSEQLVSLLDHDKLAIRVLTIDQINALTGQTLRYRAGSPPAQRKNAKKQWEQYVAKNKGLLK